MYVNGTIKAEFDNQLLSSNSMRARRSLGKSIGFWQRQTVACSPVARRRENKVQYLLDISQRPLESQISGFL